MSAKPLALAPALSIQTPKHDAIKGAALVQSSGLSQYIVTLSMWHKHTSMRFVCAGMPFKGAPLLLPVDLNLTLMVEEQSLQASIVAPLLYAQLSCAGIEMLGRLAHSFTGDTVVSSSFMY